MDTDASRTARDEDSRDSRTWEGERPQPVENRDVVGETRGITPDAEDPVNAVNAAARPSDFSLREIEEGETPLDEEMELMVDPSIGPERLSNNPDVLDLDSTWRREGEEADFMADPGTTDVIEAIEEGEPYFPPTDPPTRRERAENVDVLGGFSSTSLEEPTEVEDHPLRLQTNDEEIAERVRYALAADAYTADLNIEVEVEGGIVYLTGQVRSLEDIDQAEQVAGSVPGVEDVEENLEIV